MIRHALACLALVACGRGTSSSDAGSDTGAEWAILDGGRCTRPYPSHCEAATSCFIDCVGCTGGGYWPVSNGPVPYIFVCRGNTWDRDPNFTEFDCFGPGLFVDPECKIWSDGGDAASDGEAGADADAQAE